MKREEKVAKEYLSLIGNDIEFEPDGNRPPDFLIDKEIAVEVRRLNMHYKGEPIERVEFEVKSKMEGLISSVQSEVYHRSNFVNYYFSRPILFDKKVKKEVHSILLQKLQNLDSTEEYQINSGLSLKIFPASNKLDSVFHSGMTIDKNSGGFVLGNILESLQTLIDEKHSKINPYQNNYKVWWLALVDFIGYGLSAMEVDKIPKEEIDNKCFKRILFIPPLNPEKTVAIEFV